MFIATGWWRQTGEHDDLDQEVVTATRMKQFQMVDVHALLHLGLDGDTPEVFDDVLGFVRDSGLYEVQVTFLTGFPETPLYHPLKREHRILQDHAWQLCTLFDINFKPAQMSVDQLQHGFLHLVKTLYSANETSERHRNSKTFSYHSCDTQRVRFLEGFGRTTRLTDAALESSISGICCI